MDDSYDIPHRHRDLEALYRLHLDAMLDLAHSITGDRASAEDACQSVFRKLLSQEPPPAEIGLSYLLVATRHACRDHLRATRRLVPLDDIHPAAPSLDLDHTGEREQFWAEWHATLSPKEREAIEQHLEGLSQEEIADAMGCGRRTVGTFLLRARRKGRALAQERERSFRILRIPSALTIIEASPESAHYRGTGWGGRMRVGRRREAVKEIVPA